MKNEKLINAMNQIDNKYILQAHSKRRLFQFNAQTLSRLVVTLGCITLVLMIFPLGFSAKNGAVQESDYASDVADYNYNGGKYELYERKESSSTVEGYESSGSSAVGEKQETQSSVANQLTKRIVNGAMQMSSSNLDETVQAVKEQIKAVDGYIQSETRNYYTSSSSYFNATIRIPAGNYDEFVEQMYGIATVNYYDESCRDITEQYNDYQARLSVLKSEEQRLVEFYDQAKSVSELLEIESKLSNVRCEIESIETTLRNYDTLVAYSTLYLTVNQTNNYTYEEPDFFEQLGYAFKDGWFAFVDFLKEIVLNITFNLWSILAVVAITAGILFIIRKKSKGKAAKQKQAETQEIKQ